MKMKNNTYKGIGLKKEMGLGSCNILVKSYSGERPFTPEHHASKRNKEVTRFIDRERKKLSRKYGKIKYIFEKGAFNYFIDFYREKNEEEFKAEKDSLIKKYKSEIFKNQKTINRLKVRNNYLEKQIK